MSEAQEIRHIRWIDFTDHEGIGRWSGITNIGLLVDYEIECWQHSKRGMIYDPIELVRAYQNGRLTIARRVRIEGDDVPYHIHSLKEAQDVCLRHARGEYPRWTT